MLVNVFFFFHLNFHIQDLLKYSLLLLKKNITIYSTFVRYQQFGSNLIFLFFLFFLLLFANTLYWFSCYLPIARYKLQFVSRTSFTAIRKKKHNSTVATCAVYPLSVVHSQLHQSVSMLRDYPLKKVWNGFSTVSFKEFLFVFYFDSHYTFLTIYLLQHQMVD